MQAPLENPEEQDEPNVYDPTQVQHTTLDEIDDARIRSDNIITGVPAIDRDFVPAQPSDLIVILGYPSNGKTYLSNHIARYHAERLVQAGLSNKIVISVIWEQSIEEQGIADIANYTHIPANLVATGNFSDFEYQRIVGAAEVRGRMPWWLIGHSIRERKKRFRLSMNDVNRCVDWIVNKVKMDPILITLDYLQRIRRMHADPRIAYMNIVDECKDLPYNFGIPTVLNSQVGRDVYRREWALPQLDDGKETGNIEETGDKIITVWKPAQRHPIGYHIVEGSRAWIVTDDLFVVGLVKNKKGRAPVTYAFNMDWTIGRIRGEYVALDYDPDEEKKKAKGAWQTKK